MRDFPWVFGPVLLLLALTTAVAAQDVSEWYYGDWRVTFEAHDSTEDDWLVCTASTGGDGLPVLRVSAFEGDAGPPLGFPDIQLHESAPRHYVTVMRPDVPAILSVDGSQIAAAEVATLTDEEGFFNAYANLYSPDTLPTLRAMRAGTRMEIANAGQHVTTVSLKGFTAAYLKMMELCGFDGTGVVD